MWTEFGGSAAKDDNSSSMLQLAYLSRKLHMCRVCRPNAALTKRIGEQLVLIALAEKEQVSKEHKEYESNDYNSIE